MNLLWDLFGQNFFTNTYSRLLWLPHPYLEKKSPAFLFPSEFFKKVLGKKWTNKGLWPRWTSHTWSKITYHQMDSSLVSDFYRSSQGFQQFHLAHCCQLVLNWDIDLPHSNHIWSQLLPNLNIHHILRYHPNERHVTSLKIV